jgi:hypothetical protein
LNHFLLTLLYKRIEQNGIINILKIADHDIVHIQTSNPFSFNKIKLIIAVRNSGNELDIASSVAHLTDQVILNLFHIIDN